MTTSLKTSFSGKPGNVTFRFSGKLSIPNQSRVVRTITPKTFLGATHVGLTCGVFDSSLIVSLWPPRSLCDLPRTGTGEPGTDGDVSAFQENCPSRINAIFRGPALNL